MDKTVLVEAITPEMKASPDRFYVPQFETSEAVETRIRGRNTADMTLPEWNWCAICCVRMILLALGRGAISREELYEKSFAAGVFRQEGNEVIGAYHKELASFIERELGLQARPRRGMTTQEVMKEIARGAFVIASVSAEIRDTHGLLPKKKGGHFVLIYGFRCSPDHSNQLIIHNSTGFTSTNSQMHVSVDETRFNDCFSGNAIVVKPYD